MERNDYYGFTDYQIDEPERACIGCLAIYPVEQMARNKNHISGTGRSSYCKRCAKGEYRAAHRAEQLRDASIARYRDLHTRRGIDAMYERHALKRYTQTQEVLEADPEAFIKAKAFREALALKWATETKICATCGKAVVWNDFPVHTRNPDYSRTYAICWACVNADPEGRRKLKLQRAKDYHQHLKRSKPLQYDAKNRASRDWKREHRAKAKPWQEVPAKPPEDIEAMLAVFAAEQQRNNLKYLPKTAAPDEETGR